MSDTHTDPAPTSGCPRWLRALLIVSLALNLLIVGLFAGVALGGGKHGGPHPSRLEQIGGPLTRALSKDERKILGRKMRETYRERTEDRQQQHALMQALIDEMRADPFDREAVAGHMAAQREILQDRVSLGQSILIDRLAMMSAEKRRAYADRLQEGLDRRRKR
ncbi:MAG: periplasmic heavy metal sensor [Roseovarius sp.]